MTFWPCVVAYLIDHLTWPLLAVVALALMIGRVSGHKGEVFQAAAHLFVGALIGAVICTHGVPRKMLVILVALLSGVEVMCFFLLR